MSQNIIITGGASGLGRAMALRWAQAKANICIIDINPTLAKEVCQELNQIGANAFFEICDLTNSDEVKSLKLRIASHWSHIDVLINNAGVATADKFEHEPLSQWRWVFEINLFALVQVSQVFIPTFKQQGFGQIINVSSQAALTPIPYMASYNASKSAVLALSETQKVELADDNIDVSVVCPGFFKTNLGNSLKTSLPVMAKLMDKLFEKSTVSAQQVANIIFKQSQKKQFLIQTHAEGKKLFRLKRWLPLPAYLAMVEKQTRRLRNKIKE